MSDDELVVLYEILQGVGGRGSGSETSEVLGSVESGVRRAKFWEVWSQV